MRTRSSSISPSTPTSPARPTGASRSACRATTPRCKRGGAECASGCRCSSRVQNGLPHDLIPLVDAAAQAYAQVFGKRRTEDVTPSHDELDLVALALANHL